MDPHLPACCPSAGLTAEIVGQDAATVCVALRGEIDMDTADHLHHVVSATLRAAGERVVLDMAGVTFLGSCGIRALVLQQTAAEADGRRLVLRDARPIVRRVLELTGLADVFGMPAPAGALFERPA